VLIIFEMTGSYGLILPLMIANMSAYALARHYRPTPLYEALIEQDGVHLPHRKKGIGHALDNILVGDAFQPDAVVLNSKMTVAEAIEFIRSYEFTTFPIVNDALQCTGTITEMRLRRNLVNKNGQTSISEIADPCPTIFSDQPLSEAVLKMDEAHVRQLSVIEPDDCRRLVGIITMSDIVRVQAGVLSDNE